MHNHECQYCSRSFLCDEPLDCFDRRLTCDDCYIRHDLSRFIGVMVIALGVLGFVMIVANGGK